MCQDPFGVAFPAARRGVEALPEERASNAASTRRLPLRAAGAGRAQNTPVLASLAPAEGLGKGLTGGVGG